LAPTLNRPQCPPGRLLTPDRRARTVHTNRRNCHICRPRPARQVPETVKPLPRALCATPWYEAVSQCRLDDAGVWHHAVDYAARRWTRLDPNVRIGCLSLRNPPITAARTGPRLGPCLGG
jgi:hypothetical protein